jgi:hypothetical protein
LTRMSSCGLFSGLLRQTPEKFGFSSCEIAQNWEKRNTESGTMACRIGVRIVALDARWGK